MTPPPADRADGSARAKPDGRIIRDVVLAAALDAGARQIVFGVGGSASTDGGTGLLQALGAQVLDTRGDPLTRGGGALRDVAVLDLAGLHPGLRECPVILATDVANPLTGPDGAAGIFGPQKGATPDQVAELDASLRRWAKVVAEATGTDLRTRSSVSTAPRNDAQASTAASKRSMAISL